MKKRIAFYLLLICLGTNFSLAQSYSPSWSTNPSGTLKDDVAGTTTDPNGNVFVVGHFASPTITFGSTTLTNVGNVANGYTDAYVVKYDSNGNVLWAIRGGGLYNDDCSGIDVDGSGNVIIAGTTNSAYFSFGSITVPNTTVSYQVFIVKLDSLGNIIWVRLGGGTQNDFTSCVSADVNGNVFVAGAFLSNTITFGTTTLNKTPLDIGGDLFVVKYDSSGNALWLRGAGGTQPDVCTAVSADPSGNVFVSGYYQSNSISFGSIILSNSSSTLGFSDIFVAKYDALGNLLWAHKYGGSSSEEISNIAADKFGNAYIVGSMGNYNIQFGNFLLSNGGFSFTYIVKFDTAGDVIWAESINVSSYLPCMSTDNDGNIYLSSTFYNSITIGSTNLVSLGDDDIYLAKFDSSGTFTWAGRYGGVFKENSIRINVDTYDNVIVVGHFFDATTTIGSNILYNTGGQDIVIFKVSPCTPSASTQNVTSCDSFVSPSGNFTYSLSGIYTDIIPNYLGCDSIITINLTVVPSPIVTILSSGPTSFCQGDSTILSAAPGFANYQWYRRNYAIPGATNENYIAKSTGNYKCIVQNAAFCSDTSNAIIVRVPCIPIGPNHNRLDGNFEINDINIEVFPNPGTGIYKIESPPGQLQILNSIGVLVYSKELYETENEFDISEFSEGIYFIQLKTENISLHRKLILSH